MNKRCFAGLLFLFAFLSLSMAIDQKEKVSESEVITLGGGCFWCVEGVFNRVEGVKSAVSGYMGGHVKDPSYEQVCEKTTGHIEVVQVTFDPKVITTEQVLALFWKMHDPTTKDRQGHDVGPQYASAIFYQNETQKNIVSESVKKAQKGVKKPIVTQLRLVETFYPAERSHQNFYARNKDNSYCRFVILPKLKQLNLEK